MLLFSNSFDGSFKKSERWIYKAVFVCFRNKCKRMGKYQKAQSRCLKTKQGSATLKTDLTKIYLFVLCI